MSLQDFQHAWENITLGNILPPMEFQSLVDTFLQPLIMPSSSSSELGHEDSPMAWMLPLISKDLHPLTPLDLVMCMSLL